MSRSTTFSKLAIGILRLKCSELMTKGFRKQVRSYLLEYLTQYYERLEAQENFNEKYTKQVCVDGSIKDLLRDMTFIPDAYRILAGEDEIHLFEVEDTHPLTINKLKLLASTWMEFHDHGIKFRLFVTDRYGSSIRELDLDLYEELLWGKGELLREPDF